MSSHVRALFLDLLQRADAAQVDARNVPMALMSATLPATFSMPWTNKALRGAWVERFEHVVRELQSYMGRRESELWDTLRAMTSHGEEEGTAPDELLSDGLRTEASELQQAQAHARALLMGFSFNITKSKPTFKDLLNAWRKEQQRRGDEAYWKERDGR